MQREIPTSPQPRTINHPTAASRFGLNRLLRALIPHPGTVITTLLAVSLFFFFRDVQAGPWSAPAAQSNSIPTVISYQGQLLKLDGTPENNAGISMTFRLYDSSSSTTPLWEETHAAVPVQDGLFQVLLGSVNAFPTAVVSTNNSLWLGVSIGADSEMQPRAQFAAVPYAMVAGTVSDGSITTDKLVDSSVTSSKLSRNVTIITTTVDVPMPLPATVYDILTATITLDSDTLVTIDASAGMATTVEGVTHTEVMIDGTPIMNSQQWQKAGLGLSHTLTTSLVLGRGQHIVKLRGSTQANNGAATGDNRTRLVIIEG